MASTVMHCHVATVSQNRHTKDLALDRAISSIIPLLERDGEVKVIQLVFIYNLTAKC